MESQEFIQGAVSMREMLARFVEQGGDKATAQSIRLNWNPSWGNDPGLIALPDHYACAVCGTVKHCDEMICPSDHRRCEDLVCDQECADDWNDRE